MTVIDINIDAGESYGAWTHGRRRRHVPVRDLGQPRLRLPRRRSAPRCSQPRGSRSSTASRSARTPACPTSSASAGAHCTSRPTRPTPTSSTRWARSPACSACSARRCTTSSCTARSRRTRPRIRRSPTACCAPCATSIPTLPIVVTPRSQLDARGRRHRPPERRRGLPRARLRARRAARQARARPGAVITDVDEAARRAVRMAVDGHGRRRRRHAGRVPPAHALHPRRQPARRAHRRLPCAQRWRPPGSSWRRSERCAGSASTSASAISIDPAVNELIQRLGAAAARRPPRRA